MTEEDELVIMHCIGFIMYKTNPGDPVRVDLEILRSALEQEWNLNLLKQLKAIMIRTFDELRRTYEQNPNYGNGIFFSQAVEISLHKQIERLHSVMRKYNASSEDLEFPEKLFPMYIKRTPSPHRSRGGRETPQPERIPLGGIPTDSTDVRFLLKVLHEQNSESCGYVRERAPGDISPRLGRAGEVGECGKVWGMGGDVW